MSGSSIHIPMEDLLNAQPFHPRHHLAPVVAVQALPTSRNATHHSSDRDALTDGPELPSDAAMPSVTSRDAPTTPTTHHHPTPPPPPTPTHHPPHTPPTPHPTPPVPPRVLPQGHSTPSQHRDGQYQGISNFQLNAQYQHTLPASPILMHDSGGAPHEQLTAVYAPSAVTGGSGQPSGQRSGIF